MVLSRNDKRKRKEGDLVDLMDPLAEPLKRTKIHAQRKFAQGAVTPVYSSASTTIKEKEKVKPAAFKELITHKRPNTEDFLTFLCFRGTSILPSNLNFFSATSKKDKSQNASKPSLPSSYYSNSNGTCGRPPMSKFDENNTVMLVQKPTSIKEKLTCIPKKQDVISIPKTIKLKTTTTAIQALKKKYQEQRLAKQRLKKFKPTCMKTRSSINVSEEIPDKLLPTKLSVTSKKIISQIENKRHGLRSTGPADNENTIPLPLKSLKKQIPRKFKKKSVIAQEDASIIDSISVRNMPKKTMIKLTTTKPIQKKFFGKAKKFEAKRVTRSHTDVTISVLPTPAVLPRRPTRKTKEAAAVYMEILGRKLISPELENEDNLSLDSFPELPNARKIAQTENEIKAKVKSLKAAAINDSVANISNVKEKEKEKDKNVISGTSSGIKSIKRKPVKPMLSLKNKRLVKVQKYQEINSDEESISSKETIKEAKSSAASRRSLSSDLIKDKKIDNRSLRSSRSITASQKNFSKLNEKQSDFVNNFPKVSKITEPQVVLKNKKESNHTMDRLRDKLTTLKRKRDSTAIDNEKDKAISVKQKSEITKNKGKKIDTEVESEEESLGSILIKMKKKKEIEKEENAIELSVKKLVEIKVTKSIMTTAITAISTTTSNMMKSIVSGSIVKSTPVEILRNQVISEGLTTKMSDDEESFRGFTKKSISKVVNTCQSHVKVNKLIEEIDSKAYVFKAHGIISSTPPILKDVKKVDVKVSTIAFPTIKPTQDKLSTEITNTVANAIVKQEPEFGDLKVSCPTTVPLNIIDIPKTLNYGRKERVNMSNEQIEKWLSESSLAKEESKVEMENVTNFKYDPGLDKPKNDPPPIPTISSHGHLLISPKIQHLVRPVNVTLSKLSDRLKKASNAITNNRNPTVFLSSSQISPVKPQATVLVKLKSPEDKTEKKQKEKKESSSTPPSRKMSKDSSYGEDAVENDVISKSDGNSTADSSERKSMSPEKKVFFHQRKPFLPKVKERKVVSSASAFSPENESSVYAFESEEIEAPVSTPFRRKAKETANDIKDNQGTREKSKSGNSEAKNIKSGEDTKVTEPLNLLEEARKDEEKLPPLLEKTTPKNFELPKNFADLTNIQVLPLDKLTTSWSSVSCSASITVQVNLDNQKQQKKHQQKEQLIAESNNDSNVSEKNNETSTHKDTNADNDDDNDSGQLFYIPLQAVTRNTSAQGGQQLIQGVAVKLGTEGPTGPNQRVLLKAKLVTKPPISVARCPPIGTVQPTARLPQNVATDQMDMPSTSTYDSLDVSFKPQTSQEKKMKVTFLTKIQKSSKSKAVSGTLKGAKKLKTKNLNIYSPINKTVFPKTNELKEEARLVEAPIFRPSAKDFQDPLEYIEKIRPVAEKFGICKVIPPSNFKPECKVSDDMRFTAYNHYVHKMLHRWGPNVKEMMAIKKYLATQSIVLTQAPWVGGMEIDLPHLYQTVQNLGGLKEVIEKKKWQKVADGMKIPRSAQDRITKLDDIYCKYLLPYDTLSQDERDKLFKDVEDNWLKREKQETQYSENDDYDDEDIMEEIDECIVKGRNMPLNAFYRIARNTQRMWFGEVQRSTNEADGPSAEDVESAFWWHVAEKKRHVCVHAASIDSSGRGFGFSVAKNSPFARHAWNLKILTNNAGSVLRSLGPQMGVTVPTLHVGMLFSACCWYRDPHGLPWIEYLHTGAKKIWYGIPDEQNSTFRKALTTMFPRYCKNKTIWLPSDTAMVPPDILVSKGVPLCQTVQEPGQFIIVFPKAFTSSICTGYVVSESVYFAHQSWLETAEQVFQDIHDSCEPSIFSFERLLFCIINDTRSHVEVLKQILPTVIKICEAEIKNRQKLKEMGLTNTEKLPLPDTDRKRKGKQVKNEEGDYECDTCRANLFVSVVSNPTDESIFCLTHAIQYIEKKKQALKNCTLMYTYSENELNNLINKLKDRIEAKSKKTNQIKQAK